MKKSFILLLLLAGLIALSACSPSPAALVVGGRKVDASEFAFYMHYNRLTGNFDGPPFSEPASQKAKELAIEQISYGETILKKCKEFGLKLSDEEKDTLAKQKKEVIEDLGGTSAYLAYLQENALTDRLYDKLRQNALFRQKLFDHVTQTLDEGRYSSESLRRFFGENFTLIKYVSVSLIDAEGNLMEGSAAVSQKQAADKIHSLLSQGVSFDEIEMMHYDEFTVSVNTEGLVLNRDDVEGSPQFATAFDIRSGTLSPVIFYGTDYYVFKRLELSASFFEIYYDYILDSAQNLHFSEMLELWAEENTVKTKKVVEKINLNNYLEYVK